MPTDITDRVVDSLRYSTQHSVLMRNVKPASGLTKPRAAVLVRIEGMQIELISNALIYARVLRTWGKVEHKMLLSLVLGGYVRVLECDGPLPSEQVCSEAKHMTRHLRLEVRNPGQG